MNQKSPTRLAGWRFFIFNLCLGLGHALVIFNAGAYIAMLPRVAGGLGIPPSYSTWTQTDYMIALALGFPLGAWFSRRYGEFQTVVLAFLGFALTSLFCASVRDLGPYLLGRILLGICGGVSLPGGQALLLGEYPPEKKSLGIGVWSIFTLTPFSLGPPVGGWIADTLGWHHLFWLNVPLALIVAIVLAALILGREQVQAKPMRFDLVGFIFCASVLFGVETLLNWGNDHAWLQSSDWSALALGVILALGFWVLHAHQARRPFMDLSLFGSRNFAIAVSALCLGFMLFQGLLSLLIVQIQFLLDYSSWRAGLVFLPMAVLAKPLASGMHELVRRVDARLLASISLLGFSGCYFYLSRFDHPDAFAELFWPKLLEGACLGSFFTPLTAIMLHGLPARLHGRALELANLLRIAAGAIGITLAGVVLYRRHPFHLTRFAEGHTRFDPAMDQALSLFQSAGLDEAQAMGRFARMASRSAAIHAINDAFWLAGCGFLALSALVWLAKPTRMAPPKSEGEPHQAAEELTAEEGS